MSARFRGHGAETSTHLDALRADSPVARSRFFDVRVDRRDKDAAIGQDAHLRLDVGVSLLADLVVRLSPATVHEKYIAFTGYLLESCVRLSDTSYKSAVRHFSELGT